MKDRWNRIEELFEAALALPEDERAQFLRRECGQDTGLYEEIISLLEADSLPHPLLEKSHDEVMDWVDQPPRPGERISQYEIIEQIGSGGMGDVFTAMDTDLHRKVAVKFLPKLGIATQKGLAGFLDEARIAASLNHPNIVTIFEIIEHDGRPCIIMEYVDGHSLRHLITESALYFEGKITIARQICDGLAAAHRALVIHRDVKPENIIITADGRAKILDFGIARIVRGTRSTKRNNIVGTPGYMSPEQAAGESFDHRSDIFALGVILYELFCGKQPFKREAIKETLRATINEHPLPLSHSVSEFPPELQAIIERCLAKHIDQRYQSIDDLNRDLGQFQSHYLESHPVIPLEIVKPKVISIAVLLLKTLGSPEDDYIAYGVTEDLIVDLTRIGIIRVVPMRTVLPLRDSEFSLKKIGRKLRVSHVLEGSIQIRGDAIQVSAQIITVATGDVLYANRWQTALANLPTIERQLAEGVCYAFNINPSIRANAQLSSPVSENALAYEHYLRGKYAFKHKKDSGDVEVALGLYLRAIALESDLIPARCGIAEILMLKGERDSAETELESALAISRNRSLRADEAAVLRLLARLQTTQSRWAKALEYGDESLHISKELRDLVGEATTLGILISALLPQAEYNRALEFFARVIDIHRTLDNQDELGEALKNIGTLYRQKGDYANAEKYYSDSLALARRQENLALESASLGNLGTVYHCRNELDRAAESYKQALEIDTRLGNKVAIQAWLPNLAHVLESKGHHSEALSYLERAKLLSKEIGDYKVYTHVLISSADVSINMGRFDEAANLASEAVATAERIQFLPGLAYARHQLGLAKFWKGEHSEAFTDLAKALESATAARLRRSIAWLNLNIGEFHYYLRRYPEATSSLSAALEESTQIGEQSVIRQANAYLGALKAATGDLSDAILELKHQEQDTKIEDDPKAYQVISRLLGQVLLIYGKSDADRAAGRLLLDSMLVAARERQIAPEIFWLQSILEAN